jgi:hypothetical protein
MPAIAERLLAKYLIRDEAPKPISSPHQHEAYISRLLDLQRKAHRTARGLRREAFHHREGLWRPSAQGIDEYKWTSAKGSSGGFGAKASFPLILKGKRQLNRQQMERLSQRFHVSPAVFF